MAKKFRVGGFRNSDDSDDFYDGDEEDDKDSKNNSGGSGRMFIDVTKVRDGVHRVVATVLNAKKAPMKSAEVMVFADGETIPNIPIVNGYGDATYTPNPTNDPKKDIVKYTFRLKSSGEKEVRGLKGPKFTMPPGASINNWICLGGWLLSLFLLVASFVVLISPVLEGNSTTSKKTTTVAKTGIHYTGEQDKQREKEESEEKEKGVFKSPGHLFVFSLIGFALSFIYTPFALREEIEYIKRTVKVKGEEAKIKAESSSDKKKDAPATGLWDVAKKILTSTWSKSFFGDLLAEYIFLKKS